MDKNSKDKKNKELLLKNKSKKKYTGLDIDKWEYYEISDSHTNHPEDTYRR